MTYRIYALLLILTCSLTLAADKEPVEFSSGERKVQLVELYTSQGCSSCPPADAWLSRLVESPRLWKDYVPLALHVDYWDYLGWRDPYGSSANSQRQRAYRNTGAVRSVYTPGFIVNGHEWRGFFSRDRLPSPRGKAGVLKATLTGDQLKVSYSEPAKGQVLTVAVLGFGLETKVLKGENRGRTLDSDFVALVRFDESSDAGVWRLSLPDVKARADRYGLALWVSEKGKLAPLQATGGWLPES